jgi:hypothetical protein
VRHGLSAATASKVAERYLTETPRNKRLLLSPLIEVGNLRQNNIEVGVYIAFDSEAQLPEVLNKGPLKLASYLILNVEHIAETMRAAESQWQKHQPKGRRA